MKQEDLDHLRNIESIRRVNNINWMEILRIALDRDPAATKEVLKRIQKSDAAIVELSDKIANS